MIASILLQPVATLILLASVRASLRVLRAYLQLVTEHWEQVVIPNLLASQVQAFQ